MKMTAIYPRTPTGGLSWWPLPAALAALCLAYFVTIKLSIHLRFIDALLSTFANIAPLALLAVATRTIIRRYLQTVPPFAQLVGHVPLGIAFSFIWYWSLMVLLGLQSGHSWTSFEVRPIFRNPAIAWMLLQGLTFYSLVAALTYLEFRRPEEPPSIEVSAETGGLRYFIKELDAIRPIDAREIISIRGAGDYAEVTTDSGRHLARRTLTEFETLLKPERFVRVHRTTIVNLERVASAESAGDGRMLIHMLNGEMIKTSRAGAKLVRSHVI
ncbi:MAG: LytTR family DNA-binding domain-containing protein [Sphingomicrobium sp.]